VLGGRGCAAAVRDEDLVDELTVGLAAVRDAGARIRDLMLRGEHRVEGVAARAVRVEQRPVDVEQVENGHGFGVGFELVLKPRRSATRSTV